MAQTKAGAIKARQTMIAKYGSEEKYLEVMRTNAAKGGHAHLLPGGFAYMKIHNPYRLSELGRIGGSKSKPRQFDFTKASKQSVARLSKRFG